MTDHRSPKYLPIVPPQTLIEPLKLTVEGAFLVALNQYRQARHAYYSAYRDQAPGDEQALLLREFSHRGEMLAVHLEAAASSSLGEPDDWSRD